MKKILLLTMTMLGALSCSIDNEDVQYDKAVLKKENAEPALTTFALPTCFTNLTAEVSVNGSLGNPTLVFTPTVTGSISFAARYWARVEIQPLSVCGNTSSVTGSIISFGPSTPVQNVVTNPPVISIQPSSLPLCYKWRFVIEEINGGGTVICNSSTKWKAAPVY